MLSRLNYRYEIPLWTYFVIYKQPIKNFSIEVWWVNLSLGKLILGKATWNDAARNYIKSVPNQIEDIDQLFKATANGDAEKFKSILDKNKKYLLARDNQGRTPMHVAAQNGFSSIVKQVLSENAEYTQITDPVG